MKNITKFKKMKYKTEEKDMKKISLNSIINFIMFFYILSLYFFTYRKGFTIISNVLAFMLVLAIWMNFLLTKRKLVFNKFLFIYLLFIVICIISAFFALNQSIAITKVRTLILIFLVMVSLANYIDTFEKLRKFINYFIYSGVMASIYILINSDFSQLTRYGSELGNVNAIGIIIGISVTFCFYTILSHKKYLHILFLLIMIPTILLTGSRKALLFIVMNLILIIYFRNRKSFKNIFKFIIVTILILIISYYLIFNIPLFYQIIGKRMEDMFSFVFGEGTNEGSMNIRAYMTKFGFEMFKNRPLIGYGIDNYRVLFGRNTGGVGTYAHNNYIELMVDTGIFGVLVYYFTHIIVLKDLFKSTRKAMDKTICFTLIAIIISYIILAPSQVYYDDKHFSFLLVISSIVGNIVELSINSKQISNN